MSRRCGEFIVKNMQKNRNRKLKPDRLFDDFLKKLCSLQPRYHRIKRDCMFNQAYAVNYVVDDLFG